MSYYPMRLQSYVLFVSRDISILTHLDAIVIKTNNTLVI